METDAFLLLQLILECGVVLNFRNGFRLLCIWHISGFYLYWDSIQLCIAKIMQVIAPRWLYIPLHEHAESASSSLAYAYLCIGQDQVSQLCFHIPGFWSYCLFFHYFLLMWLSARGNLLILYVHCCGEEEKSIWEPSTATMVYCKV